MLTTGFEHSDYERSFVIGSHDVDVMIFRDTGMIGWYLEIAIDGQGEEWPHTFIADKAAYDAAMVHLRERGLNPGLFQTDNDQDLVISPLSQEVAVEGHRFEIQIYRGREEADWILELVNASGTSIIPEERFATDEDALGAALADFENEPVEVFLG